MSTRCQIRLIENDKFIDLYHHYDGYFNGVGKDITEALEVSDMTMASFLLALIKNDNSYEQTDCLHGDISYFYQLNFTKGEFYGYACTVRPWMPECQTTFLELKPSYSERINLLEEEQPLSVKEREWLEKNDFVTDDNIDWVKTLFSIVRFKVKKDESKKWKCILTYDGTEFSAANENAPEAAVKDCISLLEKYIETASENVKLLREKIVL